MFDASTTYMNHSHTVDQTKESDNIRMRNSWPTCWEDLQDDYKVCNIVPSSHGSLLIGTHLTDFFNLLSRGTTNPIIQCCGSWIVTEGCDWIKDTSISLVLPKIKMYRQYPSYFTSLLKMYLHVHWSCFSLWTKGSSNGTKGSLVEQLTTSKFPGATIRLSMTLLIFVTNDKIEDYYKKKKKGNKMC